MNRGCRAERIFEDDGDYPVFAGMLKEAAELWNIRISAYCLMPNHYHLLVHTPEGNLSRAMRHINGVYTQRFNKIHRCDGQLLRGRFKSILVEGDSYLLQLVRYIHRNPLRAGLAKGIDEYRWSSHVGYLSWTSQWDWLHKRFILFILSPNRSEWLRAYRQFMEMDDDDEIPRVLQDGRWPAVLGDEEFVNRLKARFYEEKSHPQIPESVALAPALDDIEDAVCSYYQVDKSQLIQSRRGCSNELRAVAIYLAHILRRDRLRDIGAGFHLRGYSSVSSVLERIKRQLTEDADFHERLDQVIERASRKQKGQTET